jgi:hypothetical protein
MDKTMKMSIYEAVLSTLPNNISDKHFDRNLLPQLKEPDIQASGIKYVRKTIPLAVIKPVQSQRVPGLAQKVAKDYHSIDKPFIVDKNGYLVNGHHRYDAARMLDMHMVDAIVIDASIEDLMQQFPGEVSSTPVSEVINQPADSYDPNPNTAYKQATQDSTPKYDWDPEKDYRPGTPLGPIPTIQSQTEVYVMPNRDIYIFYAKDNVVEPPKTFREKIKAWFRANTGPATGPTKDKNILGFLKLGQFEDGVKVKGVGLDSSIQGQGKAIKLYIAFSAWKKLPIYSDFTQTPSAKHMWTSLIKRYPAKVVAYDQQTKKNIPLDQAGELYHDYAPVTQKHPAKYSNQSQFQLSKTNSSTLLLKFLPDSNVKEDNKVLSKMDKEQESAKDIIQAEIDAGKLTTVAEIKEYIIQLRLAGVIRYKEDALALFKHFTIPYRGTVPEDGGGGAGSGAGAGTGGGGGAGNGSGGGASGGASGGGGEAGTGSGFVAADTMGMGTLSTYSKPKKKKKKKKTKVDFGASVYEGNDGNCYEASGREFMELARAGNKTAKLVHADITPRIGGQQGNTYGHAWIEDGAKVNDVSDNHGSNINKITNGDKIIYYGIADPTNIKKYDYKTFAEMVRKHKHWGPWSAVERLSPFEEGYFKNLDIERQERPSPPMQRSKNPMKAPDKGNWGKLIWFKNLHLSGSYSNADLKIMGFSIKNGEWVIREPAYNKIKNQLR